MRRRDPATAKRISNSDKNDSTSDRYETDSESSDRAVRAKKSIRLHVRFKIKSPLGSLAIYDSNVPPDTPRLARGGKGTRYLAYWIDVDSTDIYVYGRPLYTVADLGQALWNIGPDLQLDPEIVISNSVAMREALDEASNMDQDSTGWQLATRNLVLRLMGLIDEIDPTKINDVQLCCLDPGDCDEPPSNATIPDSPLPDTLTPRVIDSDLDDDGSRSQLTMIDIRRSVIEDTIFFVDPCGPGGGCSCPDDSTVCTHDYCIDDVCSHPPRLGYTICEDDGLECTDDVCDNGICTHPDKPYYTECTDDGNECTADFCLGSECYHPNEAGNTPCTTDYIDCTYDYCEEGVCEHIRVNALCNDGLYCTGEERCSTTTGCYTYSVPDCSDGITCTEDYCIEETNSCGHQQRNWLCNDGQFCNGVEWCSSTGCKPGSDPCPDRLCSETLDECFGCFSDSDCDDDDICTNDSCHQATLYCKHTSICDDGDPCTTNICDPTDATCSYNSLYPLPEDHISHCGNFGCDTTMLTSSIIYVNNDDDNDNNIPDFQESELVVGEDEMISINISGTGCPPTSGVDCPGHSPGHWHTVSVPSSLSAYKNVDKELYPFSATVGYPIPDQIYIEGSSSSSICGAWWELNLTFGSSELVQCCRYISQRIVVVSVNSLQWQKADPDNPELGNCPNNGGMQIFPGKTSPGDLNAATRRTVNLVATIDPPIPNVTVHAKVWDVDDPFDQIYGPNHDPGDPTVTEILNVSHLDLGGSTTGPDNRPVAEQPQILSGTTDENGQVTWPLIVSMQPGNNYRAAASVISEAVNVQIDQSDADALSFTLENGIYNRKGSWSGYSVPAVWSQMLTVWRKLTIEVDSMGQESIVQSDRECESTLLCDIEWTRFIVSDISPTIPMPVQLDTPDIGLTTVVGYLIPQGNPCDSSYENRWEGGSFKNINGTTEYLIARNSCHTTSDGQSLHQFIIVGDPGNIVVSTITIHDDDLVATPPQLPQLSVITEEITTAYKDAYIQIVEASNLLNTNPIVPWVSNLSDIALYLDYDFGTGVASNWDITSSTNFWARKFVVSYQSEFDECFEPDNYENGAISQNVEIASQAAYPSSELSYLQLSGDVLSGITIAPLIYSSPALSTVFKETIRDKDVRDDNPKFWQYVAHEIGHKTFDPNGSQGSDASEHAELGLMITGTDLQNLPELTRFRVQTLFRFRSASKW